MEIDGKHVKCSIWDTAGQERFHVITRAYYKGAHGIVLVYDVSDRKTFENVAYWLKNIREHGEKETMAVLVGNKVDVGEELQAISKEEGQKLADKRKMRFERTSAKDGTGVQVFIYLFVYLVLFVCLFSFICLFVFVFVFYFLIYIIYI